jgi:hypothetical protein
MREEGLWRKSDQVLADNADFLATDFGGWQKSNNKLGHWKNSLGHIQRFGHHFFLVSYGVPLVCYNVTETQGAGCHRRPWRRWSWLPGVYFFN